MANFPDIIGMGEERLGTSALAALAAAGTLTVGRYYYDTDLSKLYRADSVSSLGDEFVRGTASVDAVQSQLNTLSDNYNTYVTNNDAAVADRPTLSEADARYLGITATAADSTKFNGKTYSTVESEWTTDIADATAALEAKIADRFIAIGSKALLADSTSAFSAVVADAIGSAISGIADGKVEVIITMPSDATATVTGVNGSDATVSNGDRFIFKVENGAVSGSVVVVDNNDNVKFAAINSTLTQHGESITSLETAVSGDNALSLVDGKLGLGGALVRDTNITGAKAIHFKNTMNVMNVLVLQAHDDSTKFVRIAGRADGGIAYGPQAFTPFQ